MNTPSHIPIPWRLGRGGEVIATAEMLKRCEQSLCALREEISRSSALLRRTTHAGGRRP